MCLYNQELADARSTGCGINCLYCNDVILLFYDSYAVFALGSTAYPNFCAFGRRLDKDLASLGAKRMQPLAEGDELKGQQQIFKSWAETLIGVSVVYCMQIYKC